MKTFEEKISEKIVKILGHTKKELFCSNYKTALSAVFEENCDGDEFQLLYEFIYSCDLNEFKQLKKIIEVNKI